MMILLLCIPLYAKETNLTDLHRLYFGYSYSDYNQSANHQKGRVDNGYFGIEYNFLKNLSWLNTLYLGENTGGQKNIEPSNYTQKGSGISFQYETGLRVYLANIFTFFDFGLGFSTYNSPYMIKDLDIDYKNSYAVEGTVFGSFGLNIPLSKELFIQLFLREDYHYGNSYARGYMGNPFYMAIKAGLSIAIPYHRGAK